MCNWHFAADKIEYLFLILIFLDMPEDALISKIEILFANTKSCFNHVLCVLMTGDKNIFFLLCNILAKYETTVII
jgi:hypothetical protein